MHCSVGDLDRNSHRWTRNKKYLFGSIHLEKHYRSDKQWRQNQLIERHQRDVHLEIRRQEVHIKSTKIVSMCIQSGNICTQIFLV